MMTPDERRHVEEALQQGLNRHIPWHMHGAVKRYIMDGVQPGSFLTAVLENDLFGAYGRADLVNAKALPEYVQFIYSYAPAACWGSPSKVKAWIEHDGLEGVYGEEQDD